MAAAARPAEGWMTVSEAAHTLGMSRTTLLAAEEAGLLRPVRTPGGHRRYSPAELGRFLECSGATPVPDPPPSAPPPRAGDPPELVAAVRAAVRPVVRSLDAECGGVYLSRDGDLRFSAAFGVPRWLAERLGATPAPAPLVEAVGAARLQLFDAAGAGFPEPRSVGHGLAAPLGIGGLFLLRAGGREWLPGELRTVEGFGELLGAVLRDRARIVALEQRLARIAALTQG